MNAPPPNLEQRRANHIQETMKSTISFPPDLGYLHSRKLILIHVTNLYDLVAVYGTDIYHEATVAIKARLAALGAPKAVVLLGSPYIFIDPHACHSFSFYSRDAFCEHVSALLTSEPVKCAKQAVFLKAEATFIDGNAKEFYLKDHQSSSLKNKSWTSPTYHFEGQKEERYRDDMALAVDLFSQLAANTLTLAFQPIVSIKDTSIYWEGLLRQSDDSVFSGFTTCVTNIAAVERLGLIGRLDRSILWTVLDLLMEQPGIKLGCNISAQSLKFDSWWRLIFDALQTRPAVASRLTIEITETSALSHDDEAITLLRTLRVLGCKIAIDDRGAGYSTLDFVIRSRPDFLKVDKAYMRAVSSASSSPSQSMLRNLTQLYADLSACVIAEGVESEQDRIDAIVAGSQGFQGYLLGRPDVLPSWLNDPVAVGDAFAPFHSSHSC